MKKIIILVSILGMFSFLPRTVNAATSFDAAACTMSDNTYDCAPTWISCGVDAQCLTDHCDGSCTSRDHATYIDDNCTLSPPNGWDCSCSGGYCQDESGTCTISGYCYYTCDSGWETCDANDANGDGCECDTTTHICYLGQCLKLGGQSCTYGDECFGHHCIEGYCRAACIVSYDGQRCSITTDNWDNYGICTYDSDEPPASQWLCDSTEAALKSGTYYHDCSESAIGYGNECDPDSLAGEYSAAGVCGEASHGTCCNDFGVDADNSNAPSTCGAESTVCNGNNGYYCDYTGDVSWDAGDTAGTNKYRCDDTDDACIKCDANNKEMTGLSGNEAQLEGDGMCELACGAAAACDELSPGDDCGTCLKCSASCACNVNYATYSEDTTDSAGDPTVDTCLFSNDEYCESGACVSALCGNSECEPGETYSNCPQDCCKADCTNCASYGSYGTCTSSNTCRSACNGYNGCSFSTGCNGVSKNSYVCCDSNEGRLQCCEGSCSDCGPDGNQCCDSNCGAQTVDSYCSAGSCYTDTGSCSDCGNFNCSTGTGTCTSTCSQACGAQCDENSDCAVGICTSDTCICANCIVYGIALDYYTGKRIDGTITAIPIENPGNKTTATITNGEWSMEFAMKAEDVEYLTFVVNTSKKTGYTHMKLDNPKGTTMSCTRQNITLSGYSVDVNGEPITSGNVRVSVLGTDYTNTTAFDGTETWSIDFHPCLIPGKIYTLQILVSDNSGKRGETFQTYAAK